MTDVPAGRLRSIWALLVRAREDVAIAHRECRAAGVEAVKLKALGRLFVQLAAVETDFGEAVRRAEGKNGRG